jgi:hypothetical protein
MLGSPEEWPAEGGGSRIPRNDEPDQKSYGWRGGMFWKLQDASRCPGKKNNQVLMEVLVKEDWIWWNEEKNQVAIKSGKAAIVLRSGESILEDGLRVWRPGDGPILARVGGANLPIDGGGTGSNNS